VPVPKLLAVTVGIDLTEASLADAVLEAAVASPPRPF